MLTITELSADLNCSRTTLYRIIEKLNIEPHKAKRKSLLDDHQVAQIRKSLQTPHNRTSTGKTVTGKTIQYDIYFFISSCVLT